MVEDIWFEESLLPPPDLATETSKSLTELADQQLAQEKALDMAALQQAADKTNFLQVFVEEKAQGILRVLKPRCRHLAAAEAAQIPTGWQDVQTGGLANGELYLVRLGLEFDIPWAERQTGWSYSVAWCRAYLFSPDSQAQPRVLAIYPQQLYAGEPAPFKVEVGLGLKGGPVEANLGQVSTDLHLGQVTPITIGFLGDEERKPYWELRAKNKPIFGLYHFWLTVERPPECGPVYLSAMGEGNLQARFFNIPVGPKDRAWASRQNVALEQCR